MHIGAHSLTNLHSHLAEIMYLFHLSDKSKYIKKKINPNSRFFLLLGMCVHTHPAHLYHLSDNLPGAQKKKEKLFENHMWRKIIAFKET